MTLGDLTCDGEAEAGAASATGRIDAVEAVEDVRKVSRVDADAGVGNSDLGAVVGAADGDGDVAAGRRVLDRVGEQDRDCPRDRLAVCTRADRGARHVQAPPQGRIGADMDGLERRRRQFAEIRLNTMERKSLIAAGKAEQSIDENLHASGLALDSGDALSRGLRVGECPAVEHPGVALDRGQRSTQLVAGVGNKPALLG